MSAVPSEPNRELSPPRALLVAAALFAAIVPAMLAWNLPPSATFYNQAAALIGWGAVVAFIGLLARSALSDRQTASARGPNTGLFSLIAVLAIAICEAAASHIFGSLPLSLALSSMGAIGAALVMACAGAFASRQGIGDQVFKAVCIAFVIAGMMCAIVGCIQVFLPSLADGIVIARSEAGRASGNMRQPNHLASFMVWSLIAAIWLHERRVLTRAATACLVVLFTFTVTLSASRTGVLELLALAIWGLLDRRLTGTSRALLLLIPVFYGLSWLGLSAWAEAGQQVFKGEERLHQEDVSSSRFAIWSNTLALIKAQPWWGVGFGEFNLAWTLTPFPQRPTEFFDSPHNLELQLMSELGVPVGLLITALLCHALWRVFKASRDATPAFYGDGGTGTSWAAGPLSAGALRAIFMMLFSIGIHSQLEYPLWYAYFLLPTALLFGLGLGATPRSGAATAASTSAITSPRLQGRTSHFAANNVMAAGALVAVLSLASLVDYYRVVIIFAPPANAAPLAERIADGRVSVLFGHHGSYAEATSERDPPPGLDAFRDTVHYLLDTRLMMAWADAYARAGDLDRARYIAARLREFRHQETMAYFDRCHSVVPPEPAPSKRVAQRFPAEPPYQCSPPSRALTWRDFVGP